MYTNKGRLQGKFVGGDAQRHMHLQGRLQGKFVGGDAQRHMHFLMGTMCAYAGTYVQRRPTPTCMYTNMCVQVRSPLYLTQLLLISNTSGLGCICHLSELGGRVVPVVG